MVPCCLSKKKQPWQRQNGRSPWACPIPSPPFAEKPLEPLAPPSTPASLAPFADPLGPDPLLEEVLHEAASLLCRWLGRAAAQPPLPGLSVLPAVEP